jgi:fucose permease
VTHHRAIALLFAVHGVVGGSLYSSLPWLQGHFALSAGALGLVLLCQPIGAFVAMPTAARVAHRIGERRATGLLIALWVLLLPVPVLAPGKAWLYPAFALFGMLAGMSDVVMNGQGVSIERRLGRSIISGLHGLWCTGSLIAGGLGILAARLDIDPRLRLLVVAAALLPLAALGARGLPADAPRGLAQAGPAPRRFAVPGRAVLLIGVLGFCGAFVEGATGSWSGVYLARVTDAGPALATAGFTLFTLAMALTRLSGDRAVQRFGAVSVVRAGASAAVIGGLLVVTAPNAWVCILGLTLIGAGIALNVPLVFSAASRISATPGEGVAGVATLTYAASLVSPPVVGWIAGGLSYPAAFLLITAFAMAMLPLAGRLRPTPVPPVAAHTPGDLVVRQGA